MADTQQLDQVSTAQNGTVMQRPVQLAPGLPKLLHKTRCALHQCPELGFQEVETSRYLRGLLEQNGLEVHGPLATTGFYVDIEGAIPGPMIGYRADMDGLPIQDAKQVPYASRNAGVSHACGHDAHMAIGAGVALMLHRLRKELHGTVRVFFQPNEEGAPSGSIPMIRDGVLDGMEAVYCVHVDPTLQLGIYGLIDGTVTASSDRFLVRICTPTTGHSARPHQAKDTIWIATLLLHQLYQLLGRITDARNPAVFTVCIFKGGTAHNVIPSEVEFEGNLRFLNENDRDHVKHYLQRTTEQFAALHEVKITLDFRSGLPSVDNDPHMVSHIRDTIHLLFSKDAVRDITVPSMGSEDFANYLEYVPGALVRVGTRSTRHTSFPLHDAHFDIDEHCLAPTVQLMSTVLMDHTRLGVLVSS